MRYLKYLLSLLLLATFLAPAPSAVAAPTEASPVYMGSLWPSSARAAGICVENKLSVLTQGGETYDSGVLWAVLEWRSAGAPYLYYRDDNGCDHLDWSQKVIVQPVWDYNLGWCGRAFPTNYSGTNKFYKMIVKINLTSHPDYSGCIGNRQRRYHVITHEMGHAAGGLNDLLTSDTPGYDDSIMSTYLYNFRTQPTALDSYRMNWLNNESNW